MHLNNWRSFHAGEQGWHSGESSRLPPMHGLQSKAKAVGTVQKDDVWGREGDSLLGVPALSSGIVGLIFACCHMWVVVDSLLVRGFFFRYSRFSPSTKPTSPNSSSTRIPIEDVHENSNSCDLLDMQLSVIFLHVEAVS